MWNNDDQKTNEPNPLYALANITKHVTQLDKHSDSQYVPCKHDSNINIQVSPSLNKYTLHTHDTHLLIKSIFIKDCTYGHHTDFVRIVTILILLHFISHWTVLMF